MTEAQLLFVIGARFERVMHITNKINVEHLSKEAFDAIGEARGAIRAASFSDKNTAMCAGEGTSRALRALAVAFNNIPKEDERFEVAHTMLKNAGCWLNGENDHFIPVPSIKEVKV